MEPMVDQGQPQAGRESPTCDHGAFLNWRLTLFEDEGEEGSEPDKRSCTHADEDDGLILRWPPMLAGQRSIHRNSHDSIT